jgi:hypothetical protein
MDYSKFFIEKTSEGYMVRDIVSDEYLCDSNGDNTFELWAYAHDVLLTHVESQTVERYIDDRWYTSDVQDVRPDLSDDQAWEVLQEIKRTHDATVGINWDVINCTADNLFPLLENEDE